MMNAAVVGIGATEFSKHSGVSTLALALRAVAAALADAGLPVSDVDGVACHRVGDSVPAVLVAHSLGVQDLRFHYDLFGGGSREVDGSPFALNPKDTSPGFAVYVDNTGVGTIRCLDANGQPLCPDSQVSTANPTVAFPC